MQIQLILVAKEKNLGWKSGNKTEHDSLTTLTRVTNFHSVTT